MAFGIRAEDGTVGAPIFSFANDTDTGLYRIGANNVGAAANGAKVWEWDASGLTVAAGKKLISPFVGARATRGAAQSIAHNTFAAVIWDAETFDTTGFIDVSGASPTRLTVPSGYDGKYRISGSLIFDGSAGGSFRTVTPRKNGAQASRVDQNPNATFTTCQFDVTLSLVATDYIEIFVFQDSGGALNISAQAEKNFVHFEFLGS